MHFRCAFRSTLILGALLFACDTGAAKPKSGSAATVSPPDRTHAVAGGADTRDPAESGSPAAPRPTDDLVSDAPGPFDPSTAPLVCPGCKPNAGGQTGDLGSTPEPCPMPPDLLDAALEQRFRIAELRAAIDGLTFSEPLEWGQINENGEGLKTISSRSVIDGSLALGVFQYEPCSDSVFATATVTFGTRDGALATSAHGMLTVPANELGWRADTAPSFKLFAKDDLVAARGSLDLMLDPSKVEGGELFVNLGGTPSELYGSVRVRVLEFPSVEEMIASQTPSDMVHASAVLERAAAVFPSNECAGFGVAATAEQPLVVLGGASSADVLARLRPMLDAARGLDASWFHADQRTRVTVDLGAAQPVPHCAAAWSVGFDVKAHARSDDGHVDSELTALRVGVTPYTTAIEWVALGGADAQLSMTWPDGESAPSDGWVDSLIEDDSLAWPPCTHSEPCSMSAP